MNLRRVEPASLSIGKVARRAGIGVETIRFYEREGLLAAPARRDSGYRLYTERVIGRIRFIRRAKELGFSLKEIKELLQLRRNASSTCEDIREKAEAKISAPKPTVTIATVRSPSLPRRIIWRAKSSLTPPKPTPGTSGWNFSSESTGKFL